MLYGSIKILLLGALCLEQCLAVKVNTTSGRVRGHTVRVLNQTVNEFLGIPYAEPPTGELRFAKPQPITSPIEGIIDATKKGVACWQMPNPLAFFITYSEDCLVLNVWTRKVNTKALKPVMFFIHGGSLKYGTAFESLYNGKVLATMDVVIVVPNYRLGKFGFLYGGDDTAPGNAGIYDQLLALNWVRDNIHKFGGDKNQITVFGESAGAWCTSVLVLSPLAKGVFKRAILESNALLANKDRYITTKEDALASTKKLASRLLCWGPNWLSCLKNVNPIFLLELDQLDFDLPIPGTEIFPLVAQEAFKQGKFNKDLEIIAGVNKDEGSLLSLMFDLSLPFTNLDRQHFTKFVNKLDEKVHNLDAKNITDFYLRDVDPDDSKEIRWRIYDFFGDLINKCPTYKFAKLYAKHTDKSKVFFYQMTYGIQMKGLIEGLLVDFAERNLGVIHAMELMYVFGIPLLKPEDYYLSDIRMSKQMMKYWTNFAKYGNPGDWTPLISDKNKFEIRNLNPKHKNKYFENLFAETCDGFWNDYFGN